MSVSLTITAAFAERLRAAGLDRFERIMALPAPRADVTRAVPGRFTTRIEAGGGMFYVKRFHGCCAAAQARNEWTLLTELPAAGVACPTPVAFGERRRFGVFCESLLVTEEIPNATQADWWIRKTPDRRRELLAPIAEVARKFHGAGFRHKDFYLCHFFVQESPAMRVFLIDLQRCIRPSCCARRWLVKDLAQLHYSMTQQSGYTADDWRELMSFYGVTDPFLARAVEVKSARIARHTPKHG